MSADASEGAREPVVVLITAPQDQARLIAQAVVRHKMAACVNLVPAVQSVYWWEGEVQEDQEALLVAKTTSDLVAPLLELMSTVHPYENFELVVLPIVAGSEKYLDWIAASTGPQA